mgnify:CR=1 FL=1
MPLTPANPPFLLTKSARDRVGQSLEQSESEETSVIILEEDRSIDKMVARKSPFSVLTVAVARPVSGGPWRTGREGAGLGVPACSDAAASGRANAGRGVGAGVGEGEASTTGVRGGDWRGLKRLRKKARMKLINCIDIC